VHTAPGCKRIIVDPGYLESLHRPNVTLNYGAIERIVPCGVQLKTGKVVPLDVLIFGTGFSLVRVHMWIENYPADRFLGVRQLPPRLEIFGVGNIRLADYWKSKGGPEAYHGLVVPNFPNYFMLLGTSGTPASRFSRD
jgi:cation diffusion facilitator CzcD-associated flavoprotein CzcO